MDYDKMNTMLALNMAVVSVNRILVTHNRAVLDWEYRNIINRLALGNIQNHPAMTAIYKELMDFIVGRELRDAEVKHLHEMQTRREQEALCRAIADGTKSEGGLWNFLGNMSRKLESKIFGRGFMMSYYGNEHKQKADKQKISLETDTELWQLTREDIAACNALYTRLLSSSWALLSDYGLGDEYRLTSESLEALSRAENEYNPSVRLNMLKYIEPFFSVYPPYWFLCAETAYNAGREAECRRYMDKFDEVWRPVLRYDPCKLEAVKYRIRELAKSGKVSSYEDMEELKRLIGEVRKYTAPDDWESILFAGIVYFGLGDKEQGKDLLRANVNFGYEKEISGAVLAQLEAGRFDAAKLTAGLQWMVETDMTKLTAEELRKLAERGNAEAQYSVGDMYYFGNNGVSQDYGEAVKWYRKSAEQGNAYGQCDLGLMYEYGYGVPQDYGEAVKWYRKSAEQGNAYGQCNLGVMYEYGYGVPKDYGEAVKWYRKSAEQGNARGQCNLGFMYEKGYGVPQDYGEAVKWYRKSAEQGNAQGQFCLGDMYEYGKGVQRLLPEALRLYRLAAAQGDDLAKKALERLK